MSRSERRRFDKEFKKLFSTNNETCSLCGKPFAHNTKTYGGFNSQLKTSFTGDCCVKKLNDIYIQGLYVSENLQGLEFPKKNKVGNVKISGESLANKIQDLQSGFSKVEKLKQEIFKKSGLQGKTPSLIINKTAWKDDDKKWFDENPSRLHRLRDIHDGEFPKELTTRALPEDHCLKALVRQVEPGKRVRIPFVANSNAEIPNNEEIIHALFDIASKGESGKYVTINDIISLVDMYTKIPTDRH